MGKKKVLFVSQEIYPYLPETEMSLIGRHLPQKIQEDDKDIRIFMPRFGIINERRHQLHEVIRLSRMNLIVDDFDHQLIIKVGSIQQARMQVYFIDNEDYFPKKKYFHDENGNLRPEVLAAQESFINERIKILGKDEAEEIEKRIFLQVLDQNWKMHIQYLEQLRQVIGLRSFGQRDPLVEYKKEAFVLFENLLNKLKYNIITFLINIKVVDSSDDQDNNKEKQNEKFEQLSSKKIGRNEPCPCNSGKKYKHCHGSL